MPVTETYIGANNHTYARAVCVCPVCSTSFYGVLSRVGAGKDKFCSKECERKYKQPARRMLAAFLYRCSGCGQMLPASQFSEYSAGIGGKWTYCKSCDSDRKARRGKFSPEAKAEARRKSEKRKTPSGGSVHTSNEALGPAWVEFQCVWCNKPYWRNPTYVRPTSRFCCYTCFTQYRKHNRKSEWLTARYIRETQEYKEWRTSIFVRDGGRCRMCGGRSSVVHHIIRAADNLDFIMDSRNAIALCKQCHDPTIRHEKEFEHIFFMLNMIDHGLSLPHSGGAPCQ